MPGALILPLRCLWFSKIACTGTPWLCSTLSQWDSNGTEACLVYVYVEPGLVLG